MKVHRSNTNIHHPRGQDMPCFTGISENL